MEEEQQFRFTDKIKKEFEELAKNTDDEKKKIQIEITINFLNAVEQELKLIENSDYNGWLPTSELYKNLNLGRDELIGLRGNKPEIKPEEKDVDPENPPITEETLKEMDEKLEQTGGMRASPNSEFMKNYIKEYIKIDELILRPLTEFTNLVENIYTERTINDDKLERLTKYYRMSLEIIIYIIKITNRGVENVEQVFLIETTTDTHPTPVYLIIKQLFLDIIKLVMYKSNYLDDQQEETRIKQLLLATYNDWKHNTRRKGTPENLFSMLDRMGQV